MKVGALLRHTLFFPVPNGSRTATLLFLGHPLSVSAMVDSGAEENFIDSGFASQVGIALEQLPSPLDANALDGQHLARITHRTKPLELIVLGNHHETIQFFVIPSPQTPLVLGHPWLKRHNPQFDWSAGKVVRWSTYCHSTCLQSALSPAEGGVPSSKEPPNLTLVPPEYHDLGEVFSKMHALSLPPHRPYDCAIKLLPGAPLPSSRLYNLSHPEREAMEEYIQGSLSSGLIRPSSSPVGAGFFFVTKKDKSLRPCINFWGLNNITVRNKYALPLISSTFEPLQRATQCLPPGAYP